MADWWQRCLGWRPVEKSEVQPLGLPPAPPVFKASAHGGPKGYLVSSWGGMGMEENL